jgi:hypothetical protein
LTEPPHRFAHPYGKSRNGFQALEAAFRELRRSLPPYFHEQKLRIPENSG